MKKILIRVLVIILVTFCIFSILTSKTYATSISDIFSKADDFINKGQSSSGVQTISESSIKEMSNLLYNTLLIIGVVLAVIIGIFIGIKFMTGSVEEKAKTKETLIAYVAGCIVVFGAFTIWKLVVTILQST